MTETDDPTKDDSTEADSGEAQSSGGQSGDAEPTKSFSEHRDAKKRAEGRLRGSPRAPDSGEPDNGEPEAEGTNSAAPDDDAAHPAGQAKDELFEAMDHLKAAAGLLLDRANIDPALDKAKKRASSLLEKGKSDPAIGRAQKEVDEMVRRVSESAEPIADRVTSEFGLFTKQLNKWTKSLRDRAQHTDDQYERRAADDKRDGSDQDDEEPPED